MPFLTLMDLHYNEDERRWIQELEAMAQRFKANPGWQTSYRSLVKRLHEDPKRTLDDQLAMARAESPDRFLVLLKVLTDQHHLSRDEVRSFIDSKATAITPTVFRNSLLLYRRLFLQHKKLSKQNLQQFRTTASG